MKLLYPLNYKSFLLFVSILLVSNIQAQNAFFMASNEAGTNSSPIENRSMDVDCDYIIDDGTSENAVGVFFGDIMWLNSFNAAGGCEKIHTISTAWGQMVDGLPCKVILYDDPNNDGDPSDAVYMTEAITTVVNANTGIFTDIAIDPTVVTGGYFVAGLVQNNPNLEYPAALDQTTSEGYSYFVGTSTGGTFNVMVLANNDVPLISTDLAGLPGNVMIRATGSPVSPSVPVKNTAVLISFILIIGFVGIRKFFF